MVHCANKTITSATINGLGQENPQCPHHRFNLIFFLLFSASSFLLRFIRLQIFSFFSFFLCRHVTLHFESIMFSTQVFHLPLDSQWGKNLTDIFGNWDIHSSFDEYNNHGGCCSTVDALSLPQERWHNPHSAAQYRPVTHYRLQSCHNTSDMTEERGQAPRYVPLAQTNLPRHDSRHESICTRRDRRRIYPAVSHNQEEPHKLEAPPAYSFHDPSYPLPLASPRFTLPARWRFQARPVLDRGPSYNKSLSGLLSGATEGMHGHIRDIPEAVEAAPAKWRMHRVRR